MLKKLILLSLSLIASVRAMDNAYPQELIKQESAVEVTHELPEWVKRAASVTVILERGYFKNTTAIFPINDDTTVKTIKTHAIIQLATSQTNFKQGDTVPLLMIPLVACYRIPKSSCSLYWHQSEPLDPNLNIKTLMTEYNTDTFALSK